MFDGKQNLISGHAKAVTLFAICALVLICAAVMLTQDTNGITLDTKNVGGSATNRIVVTTNADVSNVKFKNSNLFLEQSCDTLPAELRFFELATNGSNYVGFKAPASLSANKIWTLPTADGSSGQVLSTDGTGVLSWATPAAGGGWTEDSANNKIYATNTGRNVGIGTTTPAPSNGGGKVLHVLSSSGAATPELRVQNTASSSEAEINLNSKTAVADVTTKISASGGVFAGTGIVGTTTSHPLAFLANNSEKVRITTAGTVGVGTTNPSAKLHVDLPSTDTTTVPLKVYGPVSILDGWQWKRPITITYSGSALTNYQVFVSITSMPLQGSDPNGYDIRFTDSDGKTLLNFWIESYTWVNAVVTANFWVKVPSIPDGGKTINLHYGKSGATSASSGDGTFDFFDDFSAGTMDTTKWTEDAVYEITDTITNGRLRVIDCTKNWITGNNSVGNQHHMKNLASVDNIAVEWTSYAENTGDIGQTGIAFVDNNSLIRAYLAHADPNSGVYPVRQWFYEATSGSESHTLPESRTFKVTRTGTTVTFYVDNAWKATGTLSSTPVKLAIAVGGYPGYAFRYSELDNIRVRQFRTTEPSTLVGSEVPYSLNIDMQNLLYVQNNSGNVGIGSGTPTARLHVNGNFVATGSKSAIVRTSSYGERKLYAIEAPTVRFVDEGVATLTGDTAKVALDPIFLETIEGEFIVHVTPYGPAELYVAERGADYFVVKSKDSKDVQFSWYVSAFRKNYGGVRLEECKENCVSK